MLILACILVFLSVTLLIGAFGSRMTLAHRRVAVERLGALQPTTYEETLAAGIASPGPSAPHWIARWFRSAGNEASPELKVVGLAPSSPTARLLLFAGFRSRSALRGFLLTRLATAIGFGVVGFLGAKQQASGPEELFAATVFLGLIGFLLPKMVLKLKARRRQHRLRLSLPDALDLLVVCVEAGMGLNQAIVRVSEELRSTHSEIADEFRLVNLE
ncbi:MAG TPA: hypothetical protein VFP98_04455, partial [Candidatus Polarisedimenticolia bacterium]|nr:hypothetical protein [Candidatus Polarisedimenticolia bacterium]